MFGYNLVKFQNKNLFLNSFNARFVHNSNQQKQQPNAVMNLKTYTDLPGPLDLPIIGSLLSVIQFS